jgi:hypothetical protein
MKKRGLDVQVLHMPSYRASSVHADKLAECLETVKIGPGTVLVLQIFDNGVYMVNTNEGATYQCTRLWTATSTPLGSSR